jgi:hypothetical protein
LSEKPRNAFATFGCVDDAITACPAVVGSHRREIPGIALEHGVPGAVEQMASTEIVSPADTVTALIVVQLAVDPGAPTVPVPVRLAQHPTTDDATMLQLSVVAEPFFQTL